MSQHSRTPTPTQSGRFIPDKSNIWRDCCDGYYDWVKEHINEVRIHESTHSPLLLMSIYRPALPDTHPDVTAPTH